VAVAVGGLPALRSPRRSAALGTTTAHRHRHALRGREARLLAPFRQAHAVRVGVDAAGDRRRAVRGVRRADQPLLGPASPEREGAATTSRAAVAAQRRPELSREGRARVRALHEAAPALDRSLRRREADADPQAPIPDEGGAARRRASRVRVPSRRDMPAARRLRGRHRPRARKDREAPRRQGARRVPRRGRPQVSAAHDLRRLGQPQSSPRRSRCAVDTVCPPSSRPFTSFTHRCTRRG
jgi:hypothetical protein